MSQQILSYINQINLRLDQLEKANEALAARVNEIERQAALPRYYEGPRVAEFNELQREAFVKRGPGRPRKADPANGTD